MSKTLFHHKPFTIFQHFLTPNPFHCFFQQVPSPPKSGTHLWSHRDFCQRGRHGELKRSSSLEKNKFFVAATCVFRTDPSKPSEVWTPYTKRWPPKGSGKPRFTVEPVSVTFFVDVLTRPKSDVMYRFSWDSVQSCTSRHRGKLVEKILGILHF